MRVTHYIKICVNIKEELDKDRMYELNTGKKRDSILNSFLPKGDTHDK
jgi:hypothetical protein